ncbi:hypothetical protein [Streptomyces cyaneofuscatus]|uniref:hypothetical protein n=1 Tax=Streptomyces griseus group TaxID=629295 RepID=UPI0037910536
MTIQRRSCRRSPSALKTTEHPRSANHSVSSTTSTNAPRPGPSAAAELLQGAGLHGHKYAIDATVAEVALRQPKPLALLTSGSDDMTKLCGNQVNVIPL